MNFYVYEWYNIDTQEVFYVGKGSKKRYKDIEHRNQMFLEYVQNNNTSSRIVRYFENEEDSFKYEKELTDAYREKGWCKCNIMDGGYGGYSSVWTNEMREYWSKNNPMKKEEQRERMRVNNPMKNPDIALKQSATNKRPVIINGVYYEGTVDAAAALGVWTNTILRWCKRGYDTNGNPCRYANEEQKEYTYKKTSSKMVQLGDIVYPSLRAAAASVGAKDTSPLCKALKTGKKYHGLECKYVNQQPSQ